MNAKRIATVILAIAFVLVAGQSAFAAGADKALLLGNWKVLQGTYSDGTVEKELDMGFSFTATTLTNPMDGSSLSYTIDEKAKTISATGTDSTILIVYKVVDKSTVEFVQMTVSAKGKQTVIVGKDGMFSVLRLGKK